MNSRLSTKGQLIIPKEIRDRHGWRPGTELEIEDHDDRLVIRLYGAGKTATLEDLFGCSDYAGPRRSLDEMEAAIARGARQQL